MLGKHILGIYPHSRRSSDARFMPPMGLEYVMTAIGDQVQDIRIVDFRYEDVYDIRPFLEARTDAVCISLNWRPVFAEGGFWAELDLINRLPRDIPTIVGGRWATQNVDMLLDHCPHVDVVVKGDGEETIRELAACSSPDDIAGICWRANGTVHHNAARPCAPPSDALYPDRNLRRYAYTLTAPGLDLGVTFDSILTSRGCPYRCKFCTFNLDGQGNRRPWQPRSPESVLAELRTVDADAVFVADNNFCHDMDRVAAICDGIVRENMRKTFAVEARVDIARRPDVLDKMVRAGFRLILFGVESATDRTLRQLGKGFTVAQAREYFKVLRRYNFVRGGFFMVGNIGESERDMRRIARFARELGVDFISLSQLRADPGSHIGELARSAPGYHIASGRKRKVYSDRYPLKKLRQVKRAIRRDFYLSPHMFRSLRSVLATGLIGPRHVWRALRSLHRIMVPRLWPRRHGALKPAGGKR